MSILLWEMGESFQNIVLWDGENTYWHEGMEASGGYTALEVGKVCPITHGRFTFVGVL